MICGGPLSQQRYAKSRQKWSYVGEYWTITYSFQAVRHEKMKQTELLQKLQNPSNKWFDLCLFSGRNVVESRGKSYNKADFLQKNFILERRRKDRNASFWIMIKKKKNDHNYILFVVYENLNKDLKETGKLEIIALITRNTGNYEKKTARKREVFFPKATQSVFSFWESVFFSREWEPLCCDATAQMQFPR